MSARDKVTYATSSRTACRISIRSDEAIRPRADNSDYASAIRALVEGDATVTMAGTQTKSQRYRYGNYQLEEFKDIDLSGMMSGGGGPLVESATYFPYQEARNSSRPVQEVAESGQHRVQKSPRSSEQILHRELLQRR